MSRKVRPLLDLGNGKLGVVLTKGKVAIIDEEDSPVAEKYNWHCLGHGYAARRAPWGISYLHQEIKGEPPDGFEIDHDDRNKLNCSRSNLIFKTHTDNMRNTERHLNRLGVSVDRTHGTFKAYLDQPDKQRINLGTRKTREEAEALVEEAKLKYGV